MPSVWAWHAFQRSDFLMVTLAVCAVKVALAWIILFVVGMSLFGNVVAGFVGGWSPPKVSFSNPAADEFLRSEYRKMTISAISSTVVAVCLVVAFLAVLFYVWGGWMLLAGIMLMIVRANDQATEARTGTRVTGGTPGLFDFVGMVFMVAVLPIIWIAIC